MHRRRWVFLLAAQVNEASGKNAFVYDECVSGGSVYNYYRDYNPETGRYIESDPIGLDGGLNTYGYSLNQPMRYDDPFGLWSLSFSAYSGGVGGGIVFGQNPGGSGFLTFQYGFGFGGGFVFDPSGTRPGYNECDDPGPGAPRGFGLGAFAQYGWNLWAASVGAIAQAGVNVNIADPGPTLNPYGPQIKPQVSGRGGFGLSIGASAGGEITIY